MLQNFQQVSTGVSSRSFVAVFLGFISSTDFDFDIIFKIMFIYNCTFPSCLLHVKFCVDAL